MICKVMPNAGAQRYAEFAEKTKEQSTKYKVQSSNPNPKDQLTGHANVRVQQFADTLNLPQEIGEFLSLYV